jgi:hypothetical protein
MFFGAVLCLLLAFFAVERRVAAYPSTHSVASITTVATGVQKPDQISFDEPQTLHVAMVFACILVLLAAGDSWRWRLIEALEEAICPSCTPTPLAVRPPPGL